MPQKVVDVDVAKNWIDAYWPPSNKGASLRNA